MSEAVQLFILGAGCSVAAGYPTAATMLPALEQFGNSLGDDAKQIRGCVGRTVQLMRRLQVPTIDELAHRLHHGRADAGNSPSEIIRNRYGRMNKAKVAVCAFFQSLESKAVATGLPSYHSFLHRLFPSDTGRHYQDQLARSTGRVLSFNYDRLFEIGFCRHFKVDQNYAFYGTLGLNSGIQAFENANLTFKENRFSFLKLHGSVGMLAYDDAFGLRIVHDTPSADGRSLSDRPKSSLLFFPHEKEYLLSDQQTAFPYREYAKQVWQRAELVAASATEIWLIGYSVCETDFPYTMRLLRTAKDCRHIVIQSTHPDPIYQKLKIRARDLADKLDPYQLAF